MAEKRYPFVVEGFIDIDLNDYDRMALPAKIRLEIFRQICPALRRLGLRGVHLSGRPYHEDAAADAEALAWEKELTERREDGERDR